MAVMLQAERISRLSLKEWKGVATISLEGDRLLVGMLRKVRQYVAAFKKRELQLLLLLLMILPWCCLDILNVCCCL